MPRDSLAARARVALAARRAELLGAAALHADGGHTRRFADALAPTLTADDVAWAHAQLAARAKGELRPTRDGAIPAHAAWSSTALVCAGFAPWRTRPQELRVAGHGPFDDVRLEERLAIPHGGGNPNLDVALARGEHLVGIESKLTEHLDPKRPRAWKPAYHRPAMAAALSPGWRALFEDLLADRWSPRHLDAGQLVRHALSLSRNPQGLSAHTLVYLFWEPGGEHPEVSAHRAEVAEVLERVAGAAPRLHALTWAELLDAWAPTLPQHVAALRERYALEVPPSSASVR